MKGNVHDIKKKRLNMFTFLVLNILKKIPVDKINNIREYLKLMII